MPFYIGVGKGDDGDYKRAYSKANRNKYWKNITNKSEYEVEIIQEGVSWETACSKEIEFIRIYGRVDTCTGFLVNMSDGGEGVSGMSEESKNKLREFRKNYVVSAETKLKLSKSRIGKKASEETKRKLSIRSKENGISKETREKMAAKLRGTPLPKWQREILSNAAMGREAAYAHVPVYQFNIRGEFIREFKSITEAAKELKMNASNIGACMRGIKNHCGGYLFRYKNNNYDSILESVRIICDKIAKNEILIRGKNRKTRIRNVKTGQLYDSLKMCSLVEGIPKGTISCWLSNGKFDKYKREQYDVSI